MKKTMILSNDELRLVRWLLYALAWIPDRWADQIVSLRKKLDDHFGDDTSWK